jgi:hypothetical protein
MARGLHWGPRGASGRLSKRARSRMSRGLRGGDLGGLGGRTRLLGVWRRRTCGRGLTRRDGIGGDVGGLGALDQVSDAKELRELFFDPA